MEIGPDDIDLEAQNNDGGVGIEGYDRVGRLMGAHPETAIFRSFSAVSAENLLYLQVEVLTLENDLRYAQEKDKSSEHRERRRYATNWERLSGSLEEDASEHDDGTQWATMLELRGKLKEYQEALLRHREIAKLEAPRRHALRDLQEWMRRPNMGNVRLVGADRDVWSRPADDLVCMESSDSWVTQLLSIPYHFCVGRFIHKPNQSRVYLGKTIDYEHGAIEKLGRVLTAVVGGLMLVVSIVALYSVNGMPVRLGLVALFISVFSFCLAVITKAKMAEIFGATSAFAAVLVVFVGSTGT